MPYAVKVRDTKTNREVTEFGPFPTEQEASIAAKEYVDENKKPDNKFYGGGLRTSEHMSYFYGFLELNQESAVVISIQKV